MGETTAGPTLARNARGMGLLVLVTTSLMSLLGAEVVIRRLAPEPAFFFEPPLYVTDDELGYRHVSEYAGTLTNVVEYTTAVRTNRLGLRGPEVRPGPEPRVLLVGDSFVFGQGVGQEEALAARLEERMRPRGPVQVLNAGVRGYGPVQEARWLHRLGAAVHPAVVVVGFYLGNDLQDDMTGIAARMAAVAPSERWHAVVTKPLFAHSHLYRALRRTLDEVTGRAAAQRAASMRSNYGVAAPGSYDNTAKALDDIQTEARALHSRLLAVLIPDAAQVLPDRRAEFGRLQGTHPDWQLDLARPNRVFAELLAARHIPVVDLTSAFAAATEAGRALYLPVDGHWSGDGQSLAAALIAERLAADTY